MCLFELHIACEVEVLGTVAEFIAVEYDSGTVSDIPFVGNIGVNRIGGRLIIIG